jgi:hypothetical protein
MLSYLTNILNKYYNTNEELNKTITLDRLIETCQTGDIIIFDGKGFISDFIKVATNSKWTHVGIIIKNPSFIKNHEKGTYIYESDGKYEPDIEEGKKIIGVQLNDLMEKIKNYEGEVYYRKLKTNKSTKELLDIFEVVHNTILHKFYDWLPQDWIAAYLALHNYVKLSKLLTDPRHLDKLFCSALVAYLYTEWGFMDKDTNWDFIAPNYFSDIDNLNDGSKLNILQKVLV